MGSGPERERGGRPELPLDAVRFAASQDTRGVHRPGSCTPTRTSCPRRRNIAKVVSQVHAFQENPYTFAPDPKLQSYLKQRIARFSGADVSVLAADSRAALHHMSSEKHSRKIQDKLRRMKATFQ